MTSGRTPAPEVGGDDTIVLIDRIGEALAQAEQRLLAGLDVDLSPVAELVADLKAPSAGDRTDSEGLERRLLVLVSEFDRMIQAIRRDLDTMSSAREQSAGRREGMLAYLKNAIR